MGLRREELAELAGLSVDYVVRLEQGRAKSPSAQVVASLTRALQLQPMERDHAYRLAGLLPPQEGTVSTHVPAGVQRMLARLGEFPVGVFSADWTLLSWTPAWSVLMGDPGARTHHERNLARAVFGAGPGRLASWPVLQDDDALKPALVVAGVPPGHGRRPRPRPHAPGARPVLHAVTIGPAGPRPSSSKQRSGPSVENNAARAGGPGCASMDVRGLQAAATISPRIAAAHSTTSSSYSARSCEDSEPPARSQSARISSFNSSAERTEPEASELGDMAQA